MTKISVSRIGLYADCSLKYKFRYVDKIEKPAVSVHLAYGSAIHSGLETINKALIAGETIDLSDVYQSFHSDYEKDLTTMGIENDYYRWTLYEMGLRTLEKYFYELIDYEPIASEIEFDVPLIWPNGEKCETHTLHGLIDVILKRKNDLIIMDYKTSKEPYKKFKLDTSIQLGAYSYAFRQLLSQDLFPQLKKKKEDYIAYCVILKNYDSEIVDIKTQRKAVTDVHIDRVLNIIQTVIMAEANEIFIPNFESSCNWCEYKKECLVHEG